MKKNFELQAAFLGYVNDNTKDKYIFSKESICFQHNETVWKWIDKYKVEKSVFFSPFRCEIFQSLKTSTLENNNDCYFFLEEDCFFFRIFGMIVFSESSEGLIFTTFCLVQIHFCEHSTPRFTNQQLIEHLCIAGNLYKGKMLMINCLTKPF